MGQFRELLENDAELRRQVDNTIRFAVNSLRRDLSGDTGRLDGNQFGDARNLYRVLGWKSSLSYQDFQAYYERHDVAQRVVDAYPDDTWATPPILYDGAGLEATRDSEFVRAFDQLVFDVDLWYHLADLDRQQRIGRYGVLFLGLGDGTEVEDEAVRAQSLEYVWGYSEGDAAITKNYRDSDQRFSKLYGMPEMYKIGGANEMVTAVDSRSDGKGPHTTGAQSVHASRCIHVVERPDRSRIYGIPPLRAVFNTLFDERKVTGGASEAIWRLVNKGVVASTKEGYKLPPGADSEQELRAEIEDYVNDSVRFLLLEGMDVAIHGGEAVDPSGMFDILMTKIAMATRIPKRILMGSELGKLAADQDTAAWAQRVMQRRKIFVEPKILKPFIQRMIDLGVLPAPVNGVWSWKWKPLFELDEVELAQVAELTARALLHLTGGKGGTGLVLASPREWRDKFTPFEPDMSEEDKAERDQLLDQLARIDENSAKQFAPEVTDVID